MPFADGLPGNGAQCHPGTSPCTWSQQKYRPCRGRFCVVMYLFWIRETPFWVWVCPPSPYQSNWRIQKWKVVLESDWYFLSKMNQPWEVSDTVCKPGAQNSKGLFDLYKQCEENEFLSKIPQISKLLYAPIILWAVRTFTMWRGFLLSVHKNDTNNTLSVFWCSLEDSMLTQLFSYLILMVTHWGARYCHFFIHMTIKTQRG